MYKRKPLGEILMEAGLITEEQLTEALNRQKKTGEFLGQILIDMGVVSKKVIGEELERQLDIPYVSLSDCTIDSQVAQMLSEHIVRRYQMLPIKKENNDLYVAMIDPLNLYIVDELKLTTGYRIQPLLTTERELQQAINKYFNVRRSAQRAIEDIKVEKSGVEEEAEESLSIAELKVMTEDAPIVRLVDSIISGAINADASDIHLEPQNSEMRVRYRVDGMLSDATTVPKHLQAAVVSRVKIIADMDIAERRRPQDGRVSISIKGKEYDFRISTLPTVFGEKVVIRILDKSRVLMGLEELGQLPDQLLLFESFITRPYGMVLVTGPTGCGKTTTLYAALNRVNTPTKNIITIEDPVEYRLPDINQMQVNPKAGITFANGLRSILRQDPNIIMVGEMRDYETAEIAIRAALTGHLVFSTLHTNDAPTAVTRLLDMDVEPFLVSSSLIGIVALRLVRTICVNCREQYEASPKVLEQLAMKAKANDNIKLSRGKGCHECDYSGYRGRTGVFELLKVTERIRELILEREASNVIRQVAVGEGMKTLFDSGCEKVLAGVTTVEEIMQALKTEEN